MNSFNFGFRVFCQVAVLRTLFLSLGIPVMAQGTLFTEEAASRGLIVLTDHNNWGNGISFHDWDRDGWPDLTFARTGLPPAFYHNVGGTFLPVAFNIPNTDEAKSVLWVDYDNDGDADLFLTRLHQGWSLYRNNGSFMFSDVTASVGITQMPGAMTMGASWGDVNNDGHLDLYICTYHHNSPITNYLFRNNGDGTFTEVASEIGVDDGANPSFQAVFADFNSDGWPDLHVSNDRLNSSNSLYLNNGDGTFEDISESSGTDFIIDAMSNTVGDFDNDGDLDIYVSNHHEGNILLRNNGDLTFTEMAEDAGVAVNQISWGALWLDQDLDGWQDLFVCTSPLSNWQTVVHNFFYTNNANGTFTYRSDSGHHGVVTRSYCAATADFNNDGAPDIAISNKHPHVAELWRNNSSGHTFLKVSLEGTVSNRDAIGATVRCYANGMMQTRHTLCGEAHFGQSSQYLLFGLNGALMADSLSVSWPSGEFDMLYGIDAGQTVHILEGASQMVVSTGSAAASRPLFSATQGGFTVRHTTNGWLQVSDNLGRELLKCPFNTSEHLLPHCLPSGVYIIRWQDSTGAAGLEKLAIP